MYQPNWKKQKNSKRCVCVYLLARRGRGRGLRRRQAEEAKVVVRQWNQKERGRTMVKIIRVLLSTLWIVRQSVSQSDDSLRQWGEERRGRLGMRLWSCSEKADKEEEGEDNKRRGGFSGQASSDGLSSLVFIFSQCLPAAVVFRTTCAWQKWPGQKTKTDQAAKSTVMAVAAADGGVCVAVVAFDCATFPFFSLASVA